jgi:hypothetical protein
LLTVQIGTETTRRTTHKRFQCFLFQKLRKPEAVLVLQRQLLNILLLLAGVAAAVIWAAAVLVDTELILDLQQHLTQITPLLLAAVELAQVQLRHEELMGQIQYLAQ